MLFPTLSVTLIGLLVGAAVTLVTHRYDWTTLAITVVGAWVGFGLGALVGVLADVILATGIWVAVAGHVLAFVGAAIAVRRQLTRIATTDR